MKARTCKGCSKDISHKHPNAKFHSQQCKDVYWNTVNPRGLGVPFSGDKYDPYRNCDDDQSWDAHK